MESSKSEPCRWTTGRLQRTLSGQALPDPADSNHVASRLAASGTGRRVDVAHGEAHRAGIRGVGGRAGFRKFHALAGLAEKSSAAGPADSASATVPVRHPAVVGEATRCIRGRNVIRRKWCQLLILVIPEAAAAGAALRDDRRDDALWLPVG